MSGRGYRLFAFLVGVLSACQSTVTPTGEIATPPSPTQQVVQVEISPALAPWLQKLSKCSQEPASSGQLSTGLVVLERPANAMSPDKTGLALRIGSGLSLDLTAALVGYEELILITHPSNPIDRLDPESLEKIFSGSLEAWKELDPEGSFDRTIQPWSYEPGDDVGAAFERLVLGEGPVNATVLQAPDPGAMLQAVLENPGAIGYIPGSWFDDRVRKILVEGEQARDYALPVVAYTTGEPRGPIRQLIACLQSKPVSTP